MSKATIRAKERYWLEPNNIETQKKYAAYVEGYNQAEKDNTSIPQTPMSKKEQWISETAVKLIACIQEEYVTSANGQVMEARHIYAARIAKEMADEIFGK